MAINRFAMMALKVISSMEYDVEKNYKLDRVLNALFHPPLLKPFRVWDRKIKVGDFELVVKIFTPDKIISDEKILFLHGGGWVSGNTKAYSSTCATLAEKTCRRVFALEYRLAPEYPFPYALEDSYAVAKAISQKYKAPLILMGDSAGGNLASVVSILAKERGEFSVSKQILLYPLTYHDHSENSPYASVTENGKDFLTTSKKISSYMSLYCPNIEDRKSHLVAPLMAEDLSNQPKTLVITAEYDPLRDEGEAYGIKLQSFGNDVNIVRMKDALHGFFNLPFRFANVKQAYEEIEKFLNKDIIRKNSKKSVK